MPASLQRYFHQSRCPWEHADINYVLGAEAIAVDFPSLPFFPMSEPEPVLCVPLKAGPGLARFYSLSGALRTGSQRPHLFFVITETLFL